MVQERIESFLILTCEKDLTGLIDLEDVTMNSGDVRGVPRDHGSRSNAFCSRKGAPRLGKHSN